MKYSESELIINADGSVFHLHLLPGQLADKVILVGDQNRVDKVAAFFDRIDCTVQNREFRTITGWLGDKRISVVSTGIGTDNIDIVLTELDALVNIDLQTREDKQNKTHLSIVRIGTSGGLQPFTPEGTFVVSQYGIGFDGLLNYYAGRDAVCDLNFERAFVQQTGYDAKFAAPYCIATSAALTRQIAGDDMVLGTTISAPGFYGPQGRAIRVPLHDASLNEKIMQFEYEGHRITNFEMEGSAIAGIAAHLGHNAGTVCCIIAHRHHKASNPDYKAQVRKLVELSLDRLAE